MTHAKIGTAHVMTCGTGIRYLGIVESATNGEIKVGEVSLLPESANLTAILESGDVSQFIPYPGEVIVSRIAIAEIVEWTHSRPPRELPGADWVSIS